MELGGTIDWMGWGGGVMTGGKRNWMTGGMRGGMRSGMRGLWMTGWDEGWDEEWDERVMDDGVG